MRVLTLPPLGLCFLAACGSEPFDGCGPESDGVTTRNGETEIAASQALEVVDGHLIVCNFDGDQSLPNLRTVTGSMNVFARTQGTLALPSLVSVGRDMVLVEVDPVLPQLAKVDKLIVKNQSRARLSLPALTRVGQLESMGPVDAPELLAVGALFTGPLIAPKLKRFNDGYISPFGQSDLQSLDNFLSVTFDMTFTSTTVVFPALREVESITFVASTNNGAMQRLALPNLESADSLTFDGLTAMTSLDVSSLNALRAIALANVPNLSRCELEALIDRTGAQLTAFSSLKEEACD